MRRHLNFAFPLRPLLYIPAIILAGQYNLSRVLDEHTLFVNHKGEPEKVSISHVIIPETVRPNHKQKIKTYYLAKFIENRTVAIKEILQKIREGLAGT